MENSCRQHVNLYEKTQTSMMLSNLHANFSFVRRRMPHEECLILGHSLNRALLHCHSLNRALLQKVMIGDRN